MNREGQNWDEEEIPGSGRSIRGYILTYIRLKTGGVVFSFGFSTVGTSISASATPRCGTRIESHCSGNNSNEVGKVVLI